MTPPRQILRGSTYLITRRCLQRQFLLRPSLLVIQIFLYVLGYAAQKHGIALHAFVSLSNHFHLLLTDLLQTLPLFTQDLDSLLARSLNFVHRRRGSLWESPEKPSYVRLLSLEDILEKAAYVLANPVSSGLVPSHRKWPGAISRVEQLGGAGALRIKRPRFFFSRSMPEYVEIRLAPPPDLEGMTLEEYRDDVRERVTARERQVRDAFERAGSRFLGKKKVLRQSPNAAPDTPGHSGFHPRVAAADAALRRAALIELSAFVVDYYAALREYRSGDHSVEFPLGTWKMRVLFNVRCESAPDSS